MTRECFSNGGGIAWLISMVRKRRDSRVNVNFGKRLVNSPSHLSEKLTFFSKSQLPLDMHLVSCCSAITMLSAVPNATDDSLAPMSAVNDSTWRLASTPGAQQNTIGPVFNSLDATMDFKLLCFVSKFYSPNRMSQNLFNDKSMKSGRVSATINSSKAESSVLFVLCQNTGTCGLAAIM